jgi:anti-anti-sigma factor
MTDLQITTKKLQADMVLIKLKGAVMNVDNYCELHKTIKTFLDYGVYKLIVDLSELGYMTSIGASIFISAGLVAQEHQGALVLVNPQPKVKTILDLIGITEVCRLANHISAAFGVLGVPSEQIGKLEQKARDH